MGHLVLQDEGGTLRWTDIRPGGSAPVLVLPGLSMPVSGRFTAVVDHPEMAARRLILLDYLGSGTSDHPTAFDYSLSSHAAAIATVLDHLQTGPVDVRGHSMGGTVGIRLALDRPDLVRYLLVAEGNLDPGGGGLSRRVMSCDRSAFLEGGFDALLADLMTRPGLAHLAESLSGAHPTSIWGNANALVNLDPALRSTFLNVPIPRTLVYGGRNTGSVAPDTPDPAALRAAGVEIVVIPDAGHSMMLDNPDAFAEAVACAFGPAP